MGTLEVGFWNGRGGNTDDTFTENEMKMLTCLSLATLSGVVGVGHMMNDEIDENAGWTGRFRISAEEAHERILLWKRLDEFSARGSGEGYVSSWQTMKENCPVPEEWDKLTELDFLKKMASTGWSCNWGNTCTAEFVHKIGWDHGFQCMQGGIFAKFSPIAQNFDWQITNMRDIAQVMTFMLHQYRLVELGTGRDIDSEQEHWFEEKLHEVYGSIGRRITPLSMNLRGDEVDYTKSVPLYYGIYDIEIPDDDEGKITVTRREDEY